MGFLGFAFGCGEWYVNGHGGVVRMQARKGRLNLVLLKGEVAHLGAFGGAHPRASRDPPSAVRGGGKNEREFLAAPGSQLGADLADCLSVGRWSPALI